MYKQFLSTLLVLIVSWGMGYAQVKVGDIAPDFNLKNTDGQMVSLSDYRNEKGVILVFTCNHCPYAKLYEQRIIDLDKKYKTLKFPVVAVNPNDSAVYEEDGFSYMVAKGFDFPYLLDNQGIYKKYGATKTPHVFLLNNVKDAFEVAYIGAIDDNPQNPDAAKEKYLEMAIKSLTNKQKANPPVTKAIGCSIKPFK